MSTTATPPTTDTPSDGSTTNEALNLSLRLTVAQAFGFVKGSEATQSFASFTFEDAMDAQIERIEGLDTPSRPNALNRITKIENDIVQAVTQIKSLPPQLFNSPSPSTDVNTPPGGADLLIE